MRSRTRPLLYLGLGLLGLLLTSTFLYQLGMSELEGKPRDFWAALEWAGETLTTTGYGKDAGWSHPLMVIFVIAVQMAGVLFVFLLLPIVLLPFLEQRFQVRLPRSFAKTAGRVVIYRYGAAVETLLEQLDQKHVPSLVIEQDEATARSLLERGRAVVWCPEDADSFAAVSLEGVRALVANGTDEENAALILSARQEGFAGDILAMAEHPYHRTPLALAGATAVFTPPHLLAAALAAHASARISPRVAGVQQLGAKLQIAEVRILEDSPLAGSTLADARIGERTGATVIGQWVNGHLSAAPTARMRLEPRGIVVAAGSVESIARFENLAEGASRLPREGPILIAGFGEVGRKVAELVGDAGERVVSIDRQEWPGVTLVGNVLDRDLLVRAEASRARVIVLALDSDEATLFATVIMKHLAPDVPVIARVSHPRNVERIYRAGADFALSLSHVAGQLLARKLLGEEAVIIDEGLKVLKTSPQGLIGHHPAEMAIRDRTGCSVVAVERAEELFVEFPPEFRFAESDCVYVCGSAAAVRRFQERLVGAD